MAISKMFVELMTSITNFSLSIKQAADATKKLVTLLSIKELERKLAHRRRCVLIAFAISQTCSLKKKHILWNLFLNT